LNNIAIGIIKGTGDTFVANRLEDTCGTFAFKRGAFVGGAIFAVVGAVGGVELADTGVVVFGVLVVAGEAV
jgi:hypothetical protein